MSKQTYSEVKSHLRDYETVRTRQPNFEESEHVEMELFHLIKAYNAIKDLVEEIDPDRFGPIKTTVVRSQEMDYHRLHLCDICGDTRCTSDHK